MYRKNTAIVKIAPLCSIEEPEYPSNPKQYEKLPEPKLTATEFIPITTIFAPVVRLSQIGGTTIFTIRRKKQAQNFLTTHRNSTQSEYYISFTSTQFLLSCIFSATGLYLWMSYVFNYFSGWFWPIKM